MSNRDKQELEDALARLAAGYDADAEQDHAPEPAQPPASSPSTPARPARPAQPTAPTRSAQPATPTARPAAPTGAAPAQRLPQQRPVVPPGALPSARNLAGAAPPRRAAASAEGAPLPTDIERAPDEAAPPSAPYSDPAPVAESAPPPDFAPAGFSPPGRTRSRVNAAIDLKRTMIPIDLVGGLMLIVLGAWHFVADPASILGSISTRFILLLPLLGLGLIGLGIWNMAKVRAAVAAADALSR